MIIFLDYCRQSFLSCSENSLAKDYSQIRISNYEKENSKKFPIFDIPENFFFFFFLNHDFTTKGTWTTIIQDAEWVRTSLPPKKYPYSGKAPVVELRGMYSHTPPSLNYWNFSIKPKSHLDYFIWVQFP